MRCPWPRSRAASESGKASPVLDPPAGRSARSGPSRKQGFGWGEWCCQTGLNCRPLHYQWSALPLSYGSMPGSGESAQKGRYRRPVLATRTPLAQARGRVGRVQECPKKSAVLLQPGQLRADPVPCFLRLRRQRVQRAKHDLEFDHFAESVEFGDFDTPKWPVADIGGKFQRGGVDAAAVQPLIYSPVLNVYSKGPTMKDDKAKRDGQIGQPVKDSRQSRLKLALRENLKRRKSQARGRSDAEGASPEEADASLDDAAGKEPGR
jgi:hypothetical protein